MRIIVSLLGVFAIGIGIIFGQIAEDESFKLFGSCLCVIGGTLFTSGCLI
jgi:hypothetical protein